MISLEPFRHVLARCPCGHGEHVKRDGYLATNNPDFRRRGGEKVSVIMCPACETIEQAEDVRLTYISAARAQRTAIAVGQPAAIAKQACRVVYLEEVTKLDGRVSTGVYRVGLRRAG